MISTSVLRVRLMSSLTFCPVAPLGTKCKKYIALNHYLNKPKHFPCSLSAGVHVPWRRMRTRTKRAFFTFYFGNTTDKSIIFQTGDKMKIGRDNNRNVRKKIINRRGPNQPVNTILRGKLLLRWLHCQMCLSHCRITEKKEAYAPLWR